LHKRPTAEVIYDKLSELYNFIYQPDESDEIDEFYESDESDESNKLANEFNKSNESDEKLKIFREFKAADNRIYELSRALQEYPDIVYASDFISTYNISQKYKEKNDQSNRKYEEDADVGGFAAQSELL
ncbi:5463_t:CDS:2, partial [Scutellospora calospora]